MTDAGIMLVECFDKSGRLVASTRLEVTGESRVFTIGRSVDADVSVSDPYVAASHLSISVSPQGEIFATDQGSKNASRIDGKPLKAGERIALASRRVEVGRTCIRIRASWDPLEPELSNKWLSNIAPTGLLGATLIGLILVLAQSIYGTWLEAPQDLLGTAIGDVLFVFGLVALWAAFWSILTRIIKGHWSWVTHLAIALLLVAVFTLFDDVATLAWFAFSLPHFETVSLAALIVMSMALIYLHFARATNLSPTGLVSVAVLLPGLLFGSLIWFDQRSSRDSVSSIDADLRVFPPAFLVTTPKPLDDYFDNVKLLKSSVTKARDDLPPSDD